MSAQPKFLELCESAPIDRLQDRIGQLAADPYVLYGLLLESKAIRWDTRHREGWRLFAAYRERDFTEMGRLIAEQLDADLEALAKDQLTDEAFPKERCT